MVRIANKIAYDWCKHHEGIYLNIFDKIEPLLETIEQKLYAQKEEFYGDDCRGDYIAELQSVLSKLESAVKELKDY